MDQERRSQKEMMQENEKQARTTYTNAQAKAAMSRRDNKASKLRVELTDPRKSNYFYEEALKTLRTNIQFAGADIKTILVTSCFPNEGKSDVVFQLAKEMGMAGKKTVLLDADIRKSVLVQRYLVDSDVKGLSQYLSGQAPVRDILYGTNYENMDVIFAGPMAPNPSELLNGKVFAKLMIELKQRYDYVLIDTPPMANVVDAAIVGKVCDGAILLIESGFVGYRAAQKAIKQLEKSGTHMLGAVLNKVDTKKEKYYSYQDDQESALKYVVTDSKNPQTIFCGTPPTPVSSGTVFTKFRKATLEGQTVNSGWAEWSVPEQTDIRDIDVWYETNPSLGTVFTERSVTDEIGSDPIDFNIQRLGLWIRYNQKSAISATEWNELKADVPPELTGDLFVGIKYSKDGNVAMGVASKTKDDKIFLECIDCREVRAGDTWILAYLKNWKARKVIIDGASGQQLMENEMKDCGIKNSHLPTVKEIIAANASFEQGLYQKNIIHSGQPSLVQVVSNCEKRTIGTNGGFGYKAMKEEMEIALLDSIILAYWACSETKTKKRKQRVSC